MVVFLAETTWGRVAVVKTGAEVGVRLLRLIGKGMLLTAEIGKALRALSPFICTGMAPWGRLLPAKIMFLAPVAPVGSVVVPDEAAPFLVGKTIVDAGPMRFRPFWGSFRLVTATGIAVAYSTPAAAKLALLASSVFISSKMVLIESCWPLGS